MSANSEAATRVVRRCIATIVAAVKRLTRPADIHKAYPLLHEPQRLAIPVAIAVAVFLFSMVAIDAAATRAVGHIPHWIVSVFDFITDFGKAAWVMWPLGLLFLGMSALPRTLSHVSQAVLAAVTVRVGFLLVAVGLPGLFAAIVKNMIGRARPGVGGSINPYLFDPFHWTPAYASLPSGHGTAAFAILAAFGTLWPRARTVLLVYAVLIAISRVVLKAHYVSDVAAGAVVGIVGVMLIRRWFALQNLGFSIGPDGRLIQFPGPSLRRIKSVARELLA